MIRIHTQQEQYPAATESCEHCGRDDGWHPPGCRSLNYAILQSKQEPDGRFYYRRAEY